MKIRAKRLSTEPEAQRESATDRQERIPGWRQDAIRQGRVLMLGAGALGNEAAKNMALMGLGYLFVADMDVISHSNLSRAVFFRERDALQQHRKAEVVARRSQALNVLPDAFVQTFYGDIVWQLGGGIFRRVDVVLGCLDNVEARLKANAHCLYTNTPFIDGGILGLAGSVTAVQSPDTACWECTTTKQERDHAGSRYDSCSNVMRRDFEAGRLPTVQVASSIVAGMQTLEAVKVIQGHKWAKGCLLQYDATAARPYSDILTIARRPACWCNKAQSIENVLELPLSAKRHTLRDLSMCLVQQGYKELDILLPDQFVIARACKNCSRREILMKPRFTLDTTVLRCSLCSAEGNEWVKLLSIGHTGHEEFTKLEYDAKLREQFLDLLLIDAGFPPLSLIQFSLSGQFLLNTVAELTDDANEVMGGSEFTTIRSRSKAI